MANLKEFNFELQTAAPLARATTHGLRMAGFCGASELAPSQREEEEEIVSGMQGGRRLKTSEQNSLATCRATLVRLGPRGGSMAMDFGPKWPHVPVPVIREPAAVAPCSGLLEEKNASGCVRLTQDRLDKVLFLC
ncbi:hypothetical protein CRENBAI_003221 [Crenichthys baileyi]|uniref:Uncharacterized protein n=1 Tax=Crenichthys baileyi TaxID=28760 RepID=A0AAV9R6H8_9TELE